MKKHNEKNCKKRNRRIRSERLRKIRIVQKTREIRAIRSRQIAEEKITKFELEYGSLDPEDEEERKDSLVNTDDQEEKLEKFKKRVSKN